MSNKKEYMDVDGHMTLNRWKDGVSDTRENREFQILKNYIPGKGEIRTREGITILSYTPGATEPDSPSVFDPYTDSDCYIILDFEDTAGLGLNNGNPPTANNTLMFAMGIAAESGVTSVNKTRYKQGSQSLYMTTDTASNPEAGAPPRYYGLYRHGDDMKDYYPGSENAAGINEWLMTMWFYTTSNKTSQYMYCGESFGVSDWCNLRLNTASLGGSELDLNVEFWADIGKTNVYNGQARSGVQQGRWYFLAAWCVSKYNRGGFYLYDDTTGVVVQSSNGLGGGFTEFYRHTSTQSIGGEWSRGTNDTDSSNAFAGTIDFFTGWGNIPTATADFTQLILNLRNLHKA